MEVNLSYIIATRNRFPFLKVTLERLMNELQPGEEIVVVDGASSDGSKEYLEHLYVEGKIHQFISERDKNQAHGWNKAILMAKGAIIKKIIDDDVFCYDAIRKCRDFMLENPAVDVVISNDLASSFDQYQHVQKMSRLTQFKKWKGGFVPSFTFGDVHMLIRRSSLALIGLYNITYDMIDWEFSLRISYFKANIAYYTGYNALSVGHSQTVTSNRDIKNTGEQGKRGHVFYEYAGDDAEIAAWSKIKIAAGKLLKKTKNNGEEAVNNPKDINEVYSFYYRYLAELNKSEGFEFLLKD